MSTEDRIEASDGAPADDVTAELRNTVEFICNALADGEPQRLQDGQRYAMSLRALLSRIEGLERRNQELQTLFNECAEARDNVGFLGTVPDCIALLQSDLSTTEAENATLKAERDEARSALKQSLEGWQRVLADTEEPISPACRDGLNAMASLFVIKIGRSLGTLPADGGEG